MASSICMGQDDKRNDNNYQLRLFKVMSRRKELRLTLRSGKKNLSEERFLLRGAEAIIA